MTKESLEKKLSADYYLTVLRSANEKLKYRAAGYDKGRYRLTKEESELYDFVHNAPSYNELFKK